MSKVISYKKYVKQKSKIETTNKKEYTSFKHFAKITSVPIISVILLAIIVESFAHGFSLIDSIAGAIYTSLLFLVAFLIIRWIEYCAQ